MRMIESIRIDIRRYKKIEEVASLRQTAELFLFNYALWAVLSYRIGRGVREECSVPVLSALLKIFTRCAHGLIGLLTGIQIPFEANIGPGLYIGHCGLVVINGAAVIGTNCNIGPGVVIGQAGRGTAKGSPVLGDNVFIGVGAKIIGRITVGDGVAIGANAVVIRDVPARKTVGGIPARILNDRGSADFMGDLVADGCE